MDESPDEHKDSHHAHPKPNHEPEPSAAPAPPSPQLPPSGPEPSTPSPMLQNAAPQPAPAPAQHVNQPGDLILQWLTYAFWGWTVLILSVLTYTVFIDFLHRGDSSSFNYYIISAALVLLPISLVCDYFYSKKEPQKKTGGASLIMIIHAVLFALFGIGSLIWCVFSVVSLMTSGGGDSTNASLYSSLVIVAFYGATFARTLNPPKVPWLTKAYKLFMLVAVGIFIVLGFLGAHHNADKASAGYNDSTYRTSPTYSSSSSSSSSSTTNYPDKEEVNQKGERRPVQYLHVCYASDGNVQYVAQGSPKCLGSDEFQYDYNPTVAGTVYSSPCKTISGDLRYVYISTNEQCPAGTKLLFYNTL